MIVFNQTESQLKIEQIEEVEKYVGLNFPNEYKDHLLKFNGGQPTPNIFKFNQNSRENLSNIDWFLAIYDGEYDNLKKEIEMVKIEEKRMPEHMLPIAHDPGGNLICISCDYEDKGHIYFWDHEKEVDYSVSDDRDYSNLYLIAKSFNEFINGLKEDILP
jgi:cell wall assembly regulator SMI1